MKHWPSGEVSEWLKELVSKTSVPLGVPRVRIPPFPFLFGFGHFRQVFKQDTRQDTSMIVIMDYGVGNIKSVINAAKHIGCDVKVSCERTYIESADGIILPGVGACGYAMNVLGPLAEVVKRSPWTENRF